MTRPTDEVTSLQYLDARDYRLVVLVGLDGNVEIAHQHADDATARDDMALLAAQIIDELGPTVVDDHLQAIQQVPPAPIESKPHTVRVYPPAAGRFVIGCRCGRVIDAVNLRRLPAVPHAPGSAPAIDPIVCSSCARKALA